MKRGLKPVNMCKVSLVLGLVLIVLAVESNCQRIITTYTPPPEPRKVRTVRDTSKDEPLWMHKGDDIIKAPSTADHPVLPSIIDDANFGPTRHARSLSTPGRGRIGSNDRGNRGNRGHDTGATHPGYNRRNARSLRLPMPDYVTPFNLKPRSIFPQPQRPKFPIYA